MMYLLTIGPGRPLIPVTCRKKYQRLITLYIQAFFKLHFSIIG